MIIIFILKQSSETDGHPWTENFSKEMETIKNKSNRNVRIFFKVSDLRILSLDLSSDWAYLRIESVSLKIDR